MTDTELPAAYIEKDANNSFEIAACESLCRGKRQTVVAEPSQQSRYAPPHCGVVIDDKDHTSIWQG
jgi:hypothetical protein